MKLLKWFFVFFCVFLFLEIGVFGQEGTTEKWHTGMYFDLNEKIQQVKWRMDSIGCNHIIALTKAGVLKHWVRGSKSPFPLSKPNIKTDKVLHGYGDFFIKSTTRNMNVSWPFRDGFFTSHARPESFPNPSDDEPPPPPTKKLEIKDGVLHYGDITKFCGASTRNALLRETQEHPDFDHWPDPTYTLLDYEKDIINAGTNYVRHVGSRDTQFLIDHCKRMKDAGIIVEIEVYDAYEGSHGVMVDIDRMGEVAEIGNVLFDVNNEFIDDEQAVSMVVEIAKKLKAQGCIVSAGAWSGENGKKYSEEFHRIYSGHDIETHHRHWVYSSWKETMEHNKPVLWNEFFDYPLGTLTLDDIERLMNEAFATGCQGVQYYAFLGGNEPLDFKDILKIAGKLLKE